MGGKGAQPQNSQMVQFEREQAAKAEAKEAKRKADLETGMAKIQQIFHGTEKTAPQKAKLSGIAALGGAMAPGQADFKHDPFPAGGFTEGSYSGIGDTGWQAYTGTEPSGGPAILAYDPQGHLRGIGSNWEQMAGTIEGQEYDKLMGTGEFENDPFGTIKDTYKTDLGKLHSQNINKTYNKALDEAIYATARAGQRGSSTVNDIMTDIGGSRYENVLDASGNVTGQRETPYGQYGEARTKAAGDIDKALGDLNTQIQSAEDSAEQQLYMTEDPGKAETAAKTLAGNIPAVPTYNTLGDMFKPLVIGASNFYSGYQGQQDFNKAFGSPKSPNESSLKKSSG